MQIGIIDTSTANIASVCFALERLGASYGLCKSPQDADGAERLILPGVGAAQAAMDQLNVSGWSKALQSETRPLLGVCLGMQLLFEWSEESDCDLLNLVPGRVERLDPGADGPWPHMGWNTLEGLKPDEPLLRDVDEKSHVYFVHGFFVRGGPHTIAHTQYGSRVSAIVRRGNVMGCQFHPERSAAVGARILQNFLEDDL